MHITIKKSIENIRIYLPYLPNPVLSFEGILRKTKKFTGMTFLCVITIKNKTLTHTSLITVVDCLLLRQLDWFWNFDLLERNDGVMADKGFNIDDLLHSKGVQLNLQSCTVFTFSISRKWLPLGKFDEFSNLNFSMFHQWDFLVLLVCYLVHQP